jgi:hypothetical protein
MMGLPMTIDALRRRLIAVAETQMAIELGRRAPGLPDRAIDQLAAAVCQQVVPGIEALLDEVQRRLDADERGH